MYISHETAANLRYGHKSVDDTSQRLYDFSLPCLKGVLLRTPGAVDPVPNTVCVWVGDARVLASSNIANGGMPIPPGESLFIPIDDVSKIWVVSTVAGQDVAWMAA